MLFACWTRSDDGSEACLLLLNSPLSNLQNMITRHWNRCKLIIWLLEEVHQLDQLTDLLLASNSFGAPKDCLHAWGFCSQARINIDHSGIEFHSCSKLGANNDYQYLQLPWYRGSYVHPSYTIVLVADIACADGGSNKLFELIPEQDR